MAVDKLIDAPGSVVPQYAVAFGSKGAAETAVDDAHPLPTEARLAAARSAALAGTASASGTVGPFAPDLARAIWVTLAGSWAGKVQLLRSTDGGVTRLPVTYADGSAKGVWTGSVNAAVAEESDAIASYWLQMTLTSGTLNYRVAQ